AETHRRKEDLAERADVEDARRRVEALQRRQRPLAMAEFAVVVVLENPGAARGDPVEEPQSPREAHGDPERVLMRGGDVHEPRPRRAAQARLDVQALVVDRDRYDAGGRRDDRSASAVVARVLDPREIARLDEQPGRERDRLLRPARDDDLLCRAADAPGRAD